MQQYILTTHFPETSIEAKNSLKAHGYYFLESKESPQPIKNYFSQLEVDTFIDSWNSLDLDNFMADGGKYRERKHANFTIKDGILNKNSYRPHYQTTNYNNLNGGVDRYFSEIDDSTIQNPLFLELMALAYHTFCNSTADTWFIEAHQFSIISSKNQLGKPTPEGMHRDGVDFVLMVMINLDNIAGGITSIYDLDKNKVTEFRLEKFFDIAMVDDKRVFHGVSEISPYDDNKDSGKRDILVLTFKRTTQ